MKLEGYFSSLSKAQNAISELQRSGFTNAHIEMGTGQNDSDFYNSWSDPNLYGGSVNPVINEASILAADANLTGGFGEIINSKHRVVVEADENSSLAMKIIQKSMGI